MNIQAIVGSGGSPRWSAETTACVSYWHIPGGSEYNHATVYKAYFLKMEDAQRFAAKYEAPPVMAAAEPWPTPVEQMSVAMLEAEYRSMTQEYRHFMDTDDIDNWNREKADREFCKQRCDALKAAILNLTKATT